MCNWAGEPQLPNQTDDIVPITNRTVIAKSDQDNVPDMFNLDDLDLE